MKKIIGYAALGTLSIAAVAFAAPGDVKTVGTIYGQTLQVRDSDDLLPTFTILGRARHVADAKGDKLVQPILLVVTAADYGGFDNDTDLGPFVQAARDKQADALVFVMASGGEMKHVVFFKGEQPVFYTSAGKRMTMASAQDVERVLETVPEEPPKPVDAKNPYDYSMRWRPLKINATGGVPLKAYQVVYEGKPETLPSDESKAAAAPTPPRQ